MKANPRKSLLALVLGFAAMLAQAQVALQKNWKDDVEKQLASRAVGEPDATKRLALLSQWKQQYPQTDYDEERLLAFFVSHVSLGQVAAVEQEAQELLSRNPSTGPLYLALLTPAMKEPSPAILNLVASSGATLVLQTTLAQKPANMSEEAWQAGQKAIQTLGYNSLGWVALQRQQFQPAETVLLKSLEINPNQGAVSVSLGLAMLQQNDPDQIPKGIHHFTRAAVYDGPGALDATTRTALQSSVRAAYMSLGGTERGWEGLRTKAKIVPTPPPDFGIKNAQEVQIEKMIASSLLPSGGVPAQPQYEDKYVEGTLFLVGKSAEGAVQVSVSKDKEIGAFIHLTNLSQDSVTIRPSDITLTAIQKARREKPEILKGYEPQVYLQKVRGGRSRRMVLASMFYGMGANMQSTAQVSGTYNGSQSGSFTATMTDHAAANARTDTFVRALRTQFQEQLAAVSQRLLRAHTLTAGGSYSGYVYFDAKKADFYNLTVPVGAEFFTFRFSLDKRGQAIPAPR